VLEVIEPGLLTTVQDRGRFAAVDLGVPVGGACDAWALGVANALAGNEPGAAALEMTLLGCTVRVVEDCYVAVAGADMGGNVVPGEGRRARRGEILAFGPAAEGSGVRTYLAVGGGVDVPLVLGSRSTCLVGGFGGLDGRPLRAGDVVAGADRSSIGLLRRWPGPPSALADHAGEAIRIVRGPDSSAAGDAFEQLLRGDWVVGGRSDRQGIRLDGAALAGRAAATMLSRGVTWGTVQLPPDGVPIVLLADHQTVGGYPVIAVVISADWPVLGQLGPGDPLPFAETSIDDAQRARRRQAAEFDRLRAALA
jgi:antagonist of KipI